MKNRPKENYDCPKATIPIQYSPKRRPFDDVSILAAARKILWQLQVRRARINSRAALAVTGGRHGFDGADFARTILEEVGDRADECTVHALIEAALKAGGEGDAC